MNLDVKRRTRLMVFTRSLLAAMLLIIVAAECEAIDAQNVQSSGTAVDATMPHVVPACQTLTLASAVDLALRQNLDIQIANIETAVRQQDRVIERSKLLPHASFDADDSVNRHNLRGLLGIQIPIPG